MTRHVPTAPGTGPTGGRRWAFTPHTWWRWYLLGGAVLLAVVPALPALARQLVFALAGLSAIVAMTVGLRRHRPPAALPWRLLLTGCVCSLSAVVYWGAEMVLTGGRQFPSLGDLLYFIAYPSFLVAIGTWVQRDRSRPGYETIVDAGIVTCGLSVLTWTFIIQPIMAEPAIERRLPSVLIYTLLDLLIVAMAVRLIFSAGIRTTAYLLALGGMVVLLTGDTVYYVGMGAQVQSVTDGIAGVLWVAAYLLYGAAALHPDMA